MHADQSLSEVVWIILFPLRVTFADQRGCVFGERLQIHEHNLLHYFLSDTYLCLFDSMSFSPILNLHPIYLMLSEH